MSKKVRKDFLLSSTKAEMSSLAAMNATIEFVRSKKVIRKIWNYGINMKSQFNKVCRDYGIEKYLYMDGVPCSPYYVTKDKNLKNSFEMRTIFQQEMIKRGVFIPWIALSYSHSDKILSQTIIALKGAALVYRKALDNGVKKYLKGNIIKPVFREFN